MEFETCFRIACDTPEDLQQLKEKCTRLKVIVLSEMDKHPLSNPRYFNSQEKKSFEKKLKHKWLNMTDDEITTEFNEIVNSRLLASGSDVSVLPCYDTNPLTIAQGSEPTIEQVPEPTVEQVPEPTVEQVLEPTVEQGSEPTVEQVLEPTVEPTVAQDPAGAAFEPTVEQDPAQGPAGTAFEQSEPIPTIEYLYP